MENEKAAAFYNKLKTQLDDTTKVWPSKYLYKFIFTFFKKEGETSNPDLYSTSLLY